MDPPTLEGVWGKLDRADEHLKALEREVRALIQADAYEARGELEDEGTQYVLRAYLGDQSLIPIGLIFGDAIQNMRTALDHLLCQMVIASGGEVTQQHQFPIRTTEPKGRALARWQARTAGLRPAFLDAIKLVQPYQCSEPERRPLAALVDLSNADKHRLVLPAVFAITDDVIKDLQLLSVDLEVTGESKATIRKPLKNGTEILRIPVRVTGPDPHMKMRGHLPIDVAFGEQLVNATGIQMLREYVRQLVQQFEALIRRECG